MSPNARHFLGSEASTTSTLVHDYDYRQDLGHSKKLHLSSADIFVGALDQARQMLLYQRIRELVSSGRRPQETVSEAVLYALPIDEEELIDWDVVLKLPPSQDVTKSISVTLAYAGRSTPIPIDDPFN
jgi:hypothetical protein